MHWGSSVKRNTYKTQRRHKHTHTHIYVHLHRWTHIQSCSHLQGLRGWKVEAGAGHLNHSELEQVRGTLPTHNTQALVSDGCLSESFQARRCRPHLLLTQFDGTAWTLFVLQQDVLLYILSRWCVLGWPDPRVRNRILWHTHTHTHTHTQFNPHTKGWPKPSAYPLCIQFYLAGELFKCSATRRVGQSHIYINSRQTTIEYHCLLLSPRFVEPPGKLQTHTVNHHVCGQAWAYVIGFF